MLGQQPGEVALEGLWSFAVLEVDAKGGEELGQSSGSGVLRACGIRVVFIPFLQTEVEPEFN